MNKTTYTPLEDPQQKIDLIDHLNDDHQEEVLAIVRAYGDPHAQQAELIDIFNEGCQLRIKSAQEDKTVFVPFQLAGDLEENILYLAYDALVRQGKALSGNKKHYFTVLSSEFVSSHMLRVHLESMQPLNHTAPGDAWFFSLKTLAKAPHKLSSSQEKMSKLAQWGNRLFLWWIKRLSAERREKMLLSFSEGKRYYSLRAIKASTKLSVDIFIHGDTPGGLWAQQLKPGDIIHSTAEYHEQTEHLHTGQAILIGDETSLPTVLAITDRWQNTLAPIIISITADPVDQTYIDEAQLPTGSKLYRINGATDVSAAVIHYLKDVAKIDVVWGALEKDDAKTIRHYLREERGIEGKSNRIKAYWKK